MKTTSLSRDTGRGRNVGLFVPARLARRAVTVLAVTLLVSTAAAQTPNAAKVLEEDTPLGVEGGNYGQVMFQGGSTVLLGPTGRVAQGFLARDTALMPGGPTYSNSYGTVVFKAGGRVTFGFAGSAMQGTLARDTVSTPSGVNGRARNVEFAAGTVVTFEDGGLVVEGTLARAVPLMLGGHDTREVPAGSVVSFRGQYATVLAGPADPGGAGGGAAGGGASGGDEGPSSAAPTSPARSIAGSSVVGNTEEVISLKGLGIVSAKMIRLLITEASGLTAANQRADSARVGEVEFYSNGTRIMPASVAAESVFSGFTSEQASDGNRQYRYISDGARGWASADKGPHSPTWIDFVFDTRVNLDEVVVTTAPSDPYRLHSFELLASGSSGTATVPPGLPPGGGAGPVDEPAAFVFDNFNGAGVGNLPVSPTVFTLVRPTYVSVIRTYHWNGGKGADPGQIRLQDGAGHFYGPWKAIGVIGAMGVSNAYWVVSPNVTLPAGSYTILDSDPSTWAQNAQSRGQGFIQVEGRADRAR